MSDPITLLLVDDYAAVRQGLRALLATAPDMRVVGEAANGEEAVQQARQLQPDVIIMDLVLPRLDGLEAIKAIRRENGRASILVLTNFGDEQRVLTAVQAGAQGYLLKDAILTNIIQAVRAVHAGQLTLHPSVMPVFLGAMQAEAAYVKSRT